MDDSASPEVAAQVGEASVAAIGEIMPSLELTYCKYIPGETDTKDISGKHAARNEGGKVR